jgi:hypothetical protein
MAGDELSASLALRLQQYTASFPDFPKNFTLPSLQDPNYVPPKRARGPLVFCYASISLATVLVLLRLYVRKFSQMKFGLDDWLIIPALVGLYRCLHSPDIPDTLFRFY